MAADQTRKPRGAELTAEQKARVEAIRAKRRTPEARAEEARVREDLERERRETGTVKVTGDGTTMGELVAFRRFIMSLRRERERQGLSLSDVAELAGIDKGALSRLENGQQVNPTVNTLTRYAHALGMTINWGLLPLKGLQKEGWVHTGENRWEKDGWHVAYEDCSHLVMRSERGLRPEPLMKWTISGPDGLVYMAARSANDDVDLILEWADAIIYHMQMLERDDDLPSGRIDPRSPGANRIRPEDFAPGPRRTRG